MTEREVLYNNLKEYTEDVALVEFSIYLFILCRRRLITFSHCCNPVSVIHTWHVALKFSCCDHQRHVHICA